jgi:hypothetical protein
LKFAGWENTAHSVETFFPLINVKSLLCVPFGFEIQIPSCSEGKFCLRGGKKMRWVRRIRVVINGVVGGSPGFYPRYKKLAIVMYCF